MMAVAILTGASLFFSPPPALAARAKPGSGSSSAIHKEFRADLIEPGVTPASELGKLLGKPVRVVREPRGREYLFYDLGAGASMDATVAVRGGVVEYLTYLCSDNMGEVKGKFAGEPEVNRKLESGGAGYTSSLSQVLYEGKGRGFVYEPRTKRVRACVAWEPGKKFDEIGR
jgi:hypothetical protein